MTKQIKNIYYNTVLSYIALCSMLIKYANFQCSHN